jgi:predicted DCC family thiol-disulfide oxidoreductase YuxK
MSANSKIFVFYDGNCALCHGLVQFALPRDKKNLIYFAPIQGETYAAKFGKLSGDPDTVIVHTPSEEILDRSDAIIFIMKSLCGPYPALANLLNLFPKSLRDTAYKIISKNRVKLFGKSAGSCPITPPSFRDKLLP